MNLKLQVARSQFSTGNVGSSSCKVISFFAYARQARFNNATKQMAYVKKIEIFVKGAVVVACGGIKAGKPTNRLNLA